MTVAVPPLELSAAKSSIPTIAPHLMPFHISYTGPAPISTYFRVKSAPKPEYGTILLEEALNKTLASESQATLVDDSTLVGSTSQVSLASTSTLAQTSEIVMDSEAECSNEPSSSHLVASFRGRTVRGLAVDLPEGYAGVILHTPDANGNNPSASSSSFLTNNKRATRGSNAKVEDDDEPDLTELADALEEESPSRKLEVSATFSSFALWNPDIPVDEGRDEYLRSLAEWTSLAGLIHDYDDETYSD